MRIRNKVKTGIVLAVLSAALGGSPAARAASGPSLSYDTYAEILGTYVDEAGRVDYAGLKANRAGLDAFVTQLAGLDPADVAHWPPDERFAMWMNAYNALTLKAVIDHYPVDSIRDIGSVLKSVWDKLQFDVMGRTLTLNHIEHEILRKEFDDARLHVGINCASVGCPPLANEPLRAERLDQQLASLARRFLADSANFRIDRNEGVVYLSSIFKWFGEDFDQNQGGVIRYVAQHVDAEDRAYLEAGRFKTKYLDYDWDLNRQ